MTTAKIASVALKQKLVQVGIKKLKKTGEERPDMRKVRIAIRMTLNDAVTTKNHLGQTFTGNPTTITFSFRFQSWNVIGPDQPKTYKDGSPVLESNGSTPVWIKGKKLCKAGLPTEEFQKQFPGLSKLCLAQLEPTDVETNEEEEETAEVA